MKNILPRRQTVLAFIVGWVMLIFLFIFTATQFNLAEITALGLNVPFADRLATTAHDLVGGLPLIATIFGFGFIIAMPITGIIARWVKILPHVAHALGGFAGVGVTLFALKALFAITPIGAARDIDGFIALCLSGAVAGYVYSALKARGQL
jgi:hypothetical protein